MRISAESEQRKTRILLYLYRKRGGTFFVDAVMSVTAKMMDERHKKAHAVLDAGCGCTGEIMSDFMLATLF